MSSFVEMPDCSNLSLATTNEESQADRFIISNNALPPLPDNVVERILEFLLGADEVKDDSNTDARAPHPRYPFTTSVMRASRDINILAEPIFARNDFILISTTYPKMTRILRNCRIWYRSHEISAFGKFRLSVHIATPYWAQQSQRRVSQFLIHKNSLEDFVYVLRRADMAMECHFNFRFTVNVDKNGQTLQVAAQAALLQPFTKVQGYFQECDINGADSELAQQITTLMTPRIHWRRAKKWEAYDLAMHAKSIADALMRTGDYRQAQLAHVAVLDVGDAAFNLMEDSVRGDDPNLCESFMRWRAVNTINQGICGVHLAVEFLPHSVAYYAATFAEEDRIRKVTTLSPAESAVWDSLVGIAYFGTRDYPKALKHLNDAKTTDPAVEAYGYCFDEIKRLEKSLTTAGARLALEKQLMIKLLSKLDYKPWDCSVVSESSIVMSIDCERDVLRALNYTGPLLEDRVQKASQEYIAEAGLTGTELKSAEATVVNYALDYVKLREERAGEELHFLIDLDGLQEIPLIKVLHYGSIGVEVNRRGRRLTCAGFLTLEEEGDID